MACPLVEPIRNYKKRTNDLEKSKSGKRMNCEMSSFYFHIKSMSETPIRKSILGYGDILWHATCYLLDPMFVLYLQLH